MESLLPDAPDVPCTDGSAGQDGCDKPIGALIEKQDDRTDADGCPHHQG